ncbi:MAG TPA: hypothetical protein VM639_09645 [Dongiaceae bacterium]|nr:hypothetical protein [Dongiaceae bacterium]
MRTIVRIFAGVLLATGLPAAAFADCLPGQSCWQPPQLQDSPVPPPRSDALQQQLNQDRGTMMQNQQQITSDRSKLRVPPATQTPLDRIQQRQQLRQDRDQSFESQRALQGSQQQMLDSHRPPAPRPYVPGPPMLMPK